MDLFNGIAEPKRRKILELLAVEGRMTAGEISSRFEVTAQAISQHLNVLLKAKLIKMEKRSQQHIFSLNPRSVREIELWAKNMEIHWGDSLNRLDEVLREESDKLGRM